MHQSTLEECVVKVVHEYGNETCSQVTTCTSKRPTWAHKNSDVLSMPREAEMILQDVELWPKFHQSVGIGRTMSYKDKQYMQRIEDFK